MQDATPARRADPAVGASESERDLLTLSLGLAAVALTVALGLVLFLPDAERSPPPANASPATSPTTLSSTTLPPTTVTIPDTTNLPTTVQPPSTTQPPAPFAMPAVLTGAWASLDASSTATFSTTSASSVVLSQLDATVDHGEFGQIRILLTWPSVIEPVPTEAKPSGVVLELLVEINGVRRPARAIGTLLLEPDGLTVQIPLEVNPALFDLEAAANDFTAEVTFRPPE